jgi:hypothetical protein
MAPRKRSRQAASSSAPAATLHRAPIELPEHVLTTILLFLRDSTSAAADAEARDGSRVQWPSGFESLYAGLIGGIGSVCRSWRRLVKGILMGDKRAWLRLQGAAEAAECLSSFPHAKSLCIIGDATVGEILAVLGLRSIARLAIANNNVMRNCKGLGQLVGLRALYITDTECSTLARSLGTMTQLTSLDLGGTLHASHQLRCERVLANAGDAMMMLRVVGWGGCARGCSGRWCFARDERRGGGACRQ